MRASALDELRKPQRVRYQNDIPRLLERVVQLRSDIQCSQSYFCELELGVREEQMEPHIQCLRSSYCSSWTISSARPSTRSQATSHSDGIDQSTCLLSCPVFSRDGKLSPLLGRKAFDLQGVKIRLIALEMRIVACACCHSGHDKGKILHRDCTDDQQFKKPSCVPDLGVVEGGFLQCEQLVFLTRFIPSSLSSLIDEQACPVVEATAAAVYRNLTVKLARTYALLVPSNDTTTAAILEQQAGNCCLCCHSRAYTSGSWSPSRSSWHSDTRNELGPDIDMEVCNVRRGSG